MSDINFSIINDKDKVQTGTSIVGEFGENVAAEYLLRNGFRMVASNFKAPIGRNRKGVQFTGEIDLIALEDDTLCFIEVKTRSSDEFASPLSAIDLRKQRQITRTARVYRKIFNIKDQKFRYDAIAIILNKHKAPKIQHIKGFWNESKFKKKAWADDIF